MKNKFIRSIARVMPVVLLGLSTFSCSDMLDIKPETTLDASQNYQNVFDADAAVIGVYGKFISLAEQHVVLNELRADLLNVTPNAIGNADLQQLNYHTVLPENKYANPRPFYELIIYCNDVLHNFTKMVNENKMTRAQYNLRYSDIAALRSWLYLQVGIQFGEIPYITSPLVNVSDLANPTKFPKIGFEVLLDSLIDFTERIPHKDVYPTGTSLLTNMGGYNSRKFFINKRLVLGDLHLWKGNYTQAATHYREILETASDVPTNTTRYFNMYRSSYNVAFSHEDGFNGTQSERWDYQWIWDLPFSQAFGPANPFIKLFANAGGQYLLKPSQRAINIWTSETRAPATTSELAGPPGDPRGTSAVRYQLGQPVVGKYLQNFEAAQPFETRGNWFLARAALVQLRFAEATNRAKDELAYKKLAEAFVQKGIRALFTPPELLVSGSDVTNTSQTFLDPPFNFDARTGDNPTFRGPWHRQEGLRKRAGLSDLNFERFTQDQVEDAIIQEAAQELAFEGHRWQDLLRIARRRNNPAFLADKVAEKFEKANDPRAAEVKARLLDPNNWYLPFRWE